MAGDDVLLRVERGLGWITLNRPKAINALDHAMVRRIDSQLKAWAEDDGIAGVVLTGAGERGLCAGGDIVSIYRDAVNGGRASIDFWQDEYELNARIAEYPKPYLAVMTGIVMGGGVGLSAHASMRVVTSSTTMAMPEVGLGFCPDVGGTWLLSRGPGELGTHLALTGERFGAADALTCGLADGYLDADAVPAFLATLSADTIETALSHVTTAVPAGSLAAEKGWIDACYTATGVPEILDRLRGRPEPAAQKAADRISGLSPIALDVTLRALRQARELPDLRAALAMELRISAAALRSHDFVEGIRAQIIDKDRNPRWQPATAAEITPAMIESYFAPLPRPHRTDGPAREAVSS